MGTEALPARSSHPVWSTVRGVAPTANLNHHRPGQMATGAQLKEMPGAEGLVEDGKFEAGFTGKQMLELGIKGSAGVHQGARGRACHVEGTASARANRQVRSSVEGWSWLILAACKSDCVHLIAPLLLLITSFSECYPPSPGQIAAWTKTRQCFDRAYYMSIWGWTIHSPFQNALSPRTNFQAW